jgi:NADH-quinone oxidoreductase subunit G
METNKAPLVKLTIDGTQISAPKGMNLIDAARAAGIEIPHYCYHPHLSIAGNCRMCQIQIKGQPKLAIACNTFVQEGLEVLTQHSSPEVKKAQEATLEFILINHPLDCTVCDQAGHCKLQDYHYEYNAKPSRFIEEKEHKVKAEPLGPTVMLDGERCIMCTRCIRFCDEITGTSELGMLNRGDRAVIAINPGRELNNPLSGTVVDLCPVGALTHREWRFNTRIWFTKQVDTICPGCSTGCNVKVAVRDNEIVQVKARVNDQVNKEWLCDEGRYGFNRFLPKNRLNQPMLNGKPAELADALKAITKGAGDTLILVSGDLLSEDYFAMKRFFEERGGNYVFVISYKERKLTEVEKILISPDYCANFRAAEMIGIVSGNLTTGYDYCVSRVRSGDGFDQVFIVGDRAVNTADIDQAFLKGLAKTRSSVAIVTDAGSPFLPHVKVALPGRSILEKSGILINRAMRAQYSERCINFPDHSEPEWRIFAKLASMSGKNIIDGVSDREATLKLIASHPIFSGLRIADVKASTQMSAATT